MTLVGKQTFIHLQFDHVKKTHEPLDENKNYCRRITCIEFLYGTSNYDKATKQEKFGFNGGCLKRSFEIC